MRILCQTFSLPKEGREFADYEDACFPASADNPATCIQQLSQSDIFRTIVCDGATDSCFSKQWAELLAQDYGEGRITESLTAPAIEQAQARWKQFVDGQELPWYAEEKAQLGAFAAVVGLTLVEEGQRFRAVAVGDCCLFQIRNSQVIESFPIGKSADFSNFPFLIGSLPERNEGVFEQKAVKEDGLWQSDDTFLLMSDAIAAWFLRLVEEGRTADCLKILMNVDKHESFAQLIRFERQRLTGDNLPSMRDDDVTLVRVAVVSSRAPAAVPRSTGTHEKAAPSLSPLKVKEKIESIKASTTGIPARKPTAETAAARQTAQEAPPKEEENEDFSLPKKEEPELSYAQLIKDSNRVKTITTNTRSRYRRNHTGLYVGLAVVVVAGIGFGAYHFFGSPSHKPGQGTTKTSMNGQSDPTSDTASGGKHPRRGKHRKGAPDTQGKPHHTPPVH